MGAVCVNEIPLLTNMSNRDVEHPWSMEQGAEARGSPVSHRIPRKLHLPWVLITGKVSHPSMSSFLLQFFDVCVCMCVSLCVYILYIGFGMLAGLPGQKP